MRIPLFPVFVLLPVLELWLMIEIGGEVGALAVILWLVAMIIVGINLLRYLGASSILQAAQHVRSGGVMPAQTLADGLFKAMGAVLLIIPGFITDVMALLCFIPLVRGLLLKRWMAKIALNASARGFNAAGFGAGPFQSGSFKAGPFAAGGNVYEHQGSSQADPNKTDAGVLIEQQPESPAAKTPKGD